MNEPRILAHRASDTTSSFGDAVALSAKRLGLAPALTENDHHR
jgi:hypothetical protein